MFHPAAPPPQAALPAQSGPDSPLPLRSHCSAEPPPPVPRLSSLPEYRHPHHAAANSPHLPCTSRQEAHPIDERCLLSVPKSTTFRCCLDAFYLPPLAPPFRPSLRHRFFTFDFKRNQLHTHDVCTPLLTYYKILGYRCQCPHTSQPPVEPSFGDRASSNSRSEQWDS
jgi:hypothetical protein